MWPLTPEFAEIVGIMLGDGCLTCYNNHHSYSVLVTLGLQESAYANYVQSLFFSVFYWKSLRITKRRDSFLLVMYAKSVFEEFIEAGFSSGNKLVNDVRIPDWAFFDDAYMLSLLRGIFDTDGCVYNKYAHYAQIQFKFAAKNLLEDTRKLVSVLGFHPTRVQKEVYCGFSSWKFYLSRQSEIDAFFELVKPANVKHILRYKMIRSKRNTFK